MTEDQRRMRAAVETIENLRLEVSILQKRCAKYERALLEIEEIKWGAEGDCGAEKIAADALDSEQK